MKEVHAYVIGNRYKLISIKAIRGCREKFVCKFDKTKLFERWSSILSSTVCPMYLKFSGLFVQIIYEYIYNEHLINTIWY